MLTSTSTERPFLVVRGGAKRQTLEAQILTIHKQACNSTLLFLSGCQELILPHDITTTPLTTTAPTISAAEKIKVKRVAKRERTAHYVLGPSNPPRAEFCRGRSDGRYACFREYTAGLDCNRKVRGVLVDGMGSDGM